MSPIRVPSVFHPWLLLLLSAAMPTLARGEEAKPDPKMEFDPAHAEKMKEGLDLFKGNVRQILIKSCVECHGGPEVESGLDLATRKTLRALAKSEGGFSIVLTQSPDMPVHEERLKGVTRLTLLPG